ncbi:MAG: anhydro-N-acetylmuramic acid kinase [Phycisphaerae bacterium]|nr:anhydro-N-acetylmuramic acid kinase [Phycisphaerae bacterium]
MPKEYASRPNANPGIAGPGPADASATREGAFSEPDERLIIGTMTGTSIDGLDAALVSVAGRGHAMRARLVDRRSADFPAELARRLRHVAEQGTTTAGELARLALDFGLFHADAITPLAQGRSIALVVVHGQTVFHAPPVSLQLLNPAPIAVGLGAPVLADLRSVDLAAGGQGAPITPLADWILFRTDHPRAVLNLGGFANATLLDGTNDPSGVRGFDVCACNQVLDAVARRTLHAPYDADGAAAAAGASETRASAELVAALTAQRAARRSLGTGDEATAWIDRHVATLRANDLAATAADAVGTAIGRAVASALADARLAAGADLVVAGGGARHRPLVAAIRRAFGGPVSTTAECGVPIEAREAMGMAVLGAVSVDGAAMTLPAVTGRREHGICDGALFRARR